jgi:hypothetical protein
MNENFISRLFMYILSKKLQNDPEIKYLENRLDKVTNDAKLNIDSMVKKGELKNTPELIKLKKSLGID